MQKLLVQNLVVVLDCLSLSLTVSAMAERLCNHFALYRPATDLFLEYIDVGRPDDAKFMLQVTLSQPHNFLFVSYFYELF